MTRAVCPGARSCLQGPAAAAHKAASWWWTGATSRRYGRPKGPVCTAKRAHTTLSWEDGLALASLDGVEVKCTQQELLSTVQTVSNNDIHVAYDVSRLLLAGHELNECTGDIVELPQLERARRVVGDQSIS
jgi:hypothetical protein